MKKEFVKITAQGNDYIYFDLRNEEPEEFDWSKESIKLSERHFGIGSDGLVLLERSEVADVKMTMYNADGSLGLMCGSALRSVIYLLSKEGIKEKYRVETSSGIRSGWISSEGGASNVTVEMGTPNILSREKGSKEQLILVDTGNIHQVRYLSDIDDFDLEKRMASLLKEDESWNYEFIEIDTPDMIRMQVWENGSGATLACGTGAVASVSAGWEAGLLKKARIKVIMPGGFVYVEKREEDLLLTGIVEEIYRGVLVSERTGEKQ